MKQSSNALMACIDTLVSPEQAFNTIKEKKGWSWLPFLIISILTAGAFYYYFNAVDFEWLKAQMIEDVVASQPGMTDDEIKVLSDNYQHGMLMWSTVIGGVVGIMFFSLIAAVYYNIATKVAAKSEFTFTQWYGFTWWTNLPTAISMIVAVLVVMFSPDGLVSMQDLQPTSLNSLLFGLDSSHAWYSFSEGLNLFAFWTIALAMVGLKSWLNIDTKKALLLAAMPTLIIYGCWALYIVISG